jgi:hypothetical protein
MVNGRWMSDEGHQTCHINTGTNDKAPISSSASNCLRGGLGGAKTQMGTTTMADRDNNDKQ